MNMRVVLWPLILMAMLGTLNLAQQSGVARQGATRSTAQPVDRETARRMDEARADGGLKAAARVTGWYRTSILPHHGPNADTLEFMVQHSPVIVVGWIGSNRCWLDADGQMISTDYEVVLEQTLKGPPADRLTLSVPGGKVAFEDGSWAQVDTPGWVPPLKGERYVLFLRPSGNAGPQQRMAAKGLIYSPTFMTLSLFRIQNNNLISPKRGSKHPVTSIYAGKPEARLVSDVLALVEHQKDR